MPHIGLGMNTHHVSASTTLYREVYGDGDPILCLHGLGASMFTWRHFITPFSQKNKLILVDFKGSGKSPKPFDRRYSIDDKAEDIYNLIIAENLTNLTLVGNSLGGGVALLVAIRLAQEDANRLSKLILIDSAGDKKHVPSHLKLIRSILGALILYLIPSKLASSMTLRVCYYDRKKITSEQIEAYSAPFENPGARYALLQTAKQCIPSNFDDIVAKLPTLKVPTLILWGREDQVIPLIVGQFLHQLIPNSTLEVIEKCGHVPHEERPDETVALISRFLATNQ
jgi:pimeloyl-ACP methyl ester carboxylesterase